MSTLIDKEWLTVYTWATSTQYGTPLDSNPRNWETWVRLGKPDVAGRVR